MTAVFRRCSEVFPSVELERVDVGRIRRIIDSDRLTTNDRGSWPWEGSL